MMNAYVCFGICRHSQNLVRNCGNLFENPREIPTIEYKAVVSKGLSTSIYLPSSSHVM